MTLPSDRLNRRQGRTELRQLRWFKLLSIRKGLRMQCDARNDCAAVATHLCSADPGLLAWSYFSPLRQNRTLDLDWGSFYCGSISHRRGQFTYSESSFEGSGNVRGFVFLLGFTRNFPSSRSDRDEQDYQCLLGREAWHVVAKAGVLPFGDGEQHTDSDGGLKVGNCVCWSSPRRTYDE